MMSLMQRVNGENRRVKGLTLIPKATAVKLLEQKEGNGDLYSD